ncbi:aminoglycoside phosphotransferase family protein [Asanoa sp. WMMD1127]|uniref:phosphotransferase enzyme family protein n=1 Tax=Asanoa sp. WMMD1127 TaxID=3016107 RepID=UPI0024168587|nr:aminoglycoside phosphotransferase family protein [Asanoa sp. WMMD1127]MDG4823503.1 aminoglycoside phosphotransferase family protein [Asanoa sp. WMMD1127]
MPVEVEAVCAAFGLPAERATLRPHAYSSSRTWQLTTDGRQFLVKDVPGDWPAERAAAMAFEKDAAAAGIPVPRQLAPLSPAFGCATRLPDNSLVRVSEWVDGRPARPTDDLADWLGTTLARLHALRPLPEAEPVVYGIHPPERWAQWLAAGRRRPWADILARRLDDLAETTDWVAAAFRAAGDYVFTHRDLEPWNVLLTPTGPVIIDWDGAGPDSAGLVAAHAAYSFGVDANAYEAHGGRLPPVGDRLARRAGLMLSRLAERLQRTLGDLDPGPFAIDDLDRTATERLRDLPTFVAELRKLK